jgi:hypothetical protein
MIEAKTFLVGNQPVLIAEEKTHVRVISTGQDILLGGPTVSTSISEGEGNYFLLHQSVSDRKEDSNDPTKVTTVGTYNNLEVILGPNEFLYAISGSTISPVRVYVLIQGK